MGRRVSSANTIEADVIAAFNETPEGAAALFSDRVARLLRPGS
jgi:hypothetical protein